MSVQICKPTDICVNHVEGRVTNVAVELRTGAESVEIQDIPNDYDEVGEVEDNEEKYNSQEGVDFRPSDDGQNCPAGERN